MKVFPMKQFIASLLTFGFEGKKKIQPAPPGFICKFLDAVSHRPTYFSKDLHVMPAFVGLQMFFNVYISFWKNKQNASNTSKAGHAMQREIPSHVSEST